MIENLSTTGIAQTQQPSSERTSENNERADLFAAGFSFSAALTVLEGRAAQSLETFGAAPVNASSTRPQTHPHASQREQSEAAPEPTALVQTAQQASAPTRAETNITTPNLHSNAQAQPTPAHSTQAVAASAGLTAQTVSSAVQTTTATKVEAAAIRAAEVEKATILKAARTASAPKPAAQPMQDFARLLARRLDAGTTSFEIRLDPPSLGRVEAQLNIADNGDKVLALKFEHQSTLDLFSNDETALRDALDLSDFDASEHALTFSLADEENQVAATTLPTDLTAFYDEPLFNVPFSQGVIDVRI